MDLTWMVVAIAGCVGLAGCILAVLLRPVGRVRQQLRALANVGRLTALPEYVRAERRRTVTAVVTMALLLTMFVGAIVAASRPTGLFTSATEAPAGDPEDIMLCVGEPATERAAAAASVERAAAAASTERAAAAASVERAAAAAMRFFADDVTSFDTQRIGLTSLNRRVIPLTRDYEWAKSQFFAYARKQQNDVAAFSPDVSYSDYAESVEDLMALCLSGFPAFDDAAGERRSLIYVGPDTLRAPGDPRAALFTPARVREMATAAGVQVNVLVSGGAAGELSALAVQTGGRAFSADANVTAHMAEIRDNPPAPRSTGQSRAAAESSDTPDLPVILALLAATALAIWPVVARR